MLMSKDRLVSAASVLASGSKACKSIFKDGPGVLRAQAMVQEGPACESQALCPGHTLHIQPAGEETGACCDVHGPLMPPTSLSGLLGVAALGALMSCCNATATMLSA